MSDTPLPRLKPRNIPDGPCAECQRELAQMTRERNEAHAALKEKGEYGYSQFVVDALSKERDALRAELDVSEKSSAEYMAERNQARDLVRAKNAEIDALRAEVERLTSAIRWACGYDEGPPEFEPPQDADKRRYWWRNELMRRDALQEPTP